MIYLLQNLGESNMDDRLRMVVTTGGFDPVHIGHIRLFREAAKLGGLLVVGLNSDEWLTRKKGRPFMPFLERLEILEAIRYIDTVVSFDDSDGTASKLLAALADKQAPQRYKLVFAKGGDRTAGNLPESEIVVAQQYDIEIVYGVGGEKVQSSSWLTDGKL